MFNVKAIGADRVDIEVGGKLDSEEMKLGLDELSSKVKGIKHGRMLYRLRDFEFPTLGAIGEELFRIPELFKIVGHFDRAAVLADEQWIRTLSELEGALIPGLKIKAFGLAEEEKAQAWLAQ